MSFEARFQEISEVFRACRKAGVNIPYEVHSFFNKYIEDYLAFINKLDNKIIQKPSD